ncbi:hypothetical protein [Streptomyces sp. 029-5]|uniref:hypothetical protein n=1 Tax=Streptomyces sp. 029-5 TaxID=2789261 RepID=UPI00397F661C
MRTPGLWRIDVLIDEAPADACTPVPLGRSRVNMSAMQAPPRPSIAMPWDRPRPGATTRTVPLSSTSYSLPLPPVA